MPDTYPSVMAALTRRYTLLALLSGRCTLALAGEGPRISDPHALLEEEADLANAMKACTRVESVALELEVTRPDLPIARAPLRKGGNVPRRSRAQGSKCEILAAVTGEAFYHEKFSDVLASGWAVARQGFLAAGLVDESRVDAYAAAIDPAIVSVLFDYRGHRTERRIA